MKLPLLFRRPALFLLLLALLGLGQRAAAQAPVAGSVLDRAGQPLAFATAVLVQLPDSSIADSQTTTELGTYAFASVRPGRYCVRGLLLSYRGARSAAFVVAGAPVVVPALRLAPAATALADVTVRGTPPVLEQRADRTVMNVAGLNTAGDNALEVLKKAPGVTLDKDDHLVYRGSSGVTVLIDGKLSYLSGDALTNYLKSLPASAISQVELIPNPPASMDAAGTAGVLNIRLRRSQLPGLSGTATATAGYGRYEKGSVGTNLAYNLHKVRLFARVDAGRYNSYNQLNVVRHIRDSLFQQQNYWHPIDHALNYAAGADLPLTARQTVGVQVRGGIAPETTRATAESVTTDANGRPAGRRTLDNPQTSQNNNFGLNLNYRWAFDSLGHELSADADYVRYTSQQDQHFNNLLFAPRSDVAQDGGQLRSAQAADVTIRAVKVDCVRPVPGTKWRAEAGAKASWVTTQSSLQFDNLRADNWQLDSLRTNQFQYDETITAAYLSLSTTLGRLELKGGLRGEHTHSLGESPTTGQRVARDYFQLFPSLFANYKFSDADQLGLSGSRRITRPAYQNLNPFISYTDFYTVNVGNPYLAPSLSNSLVLNYTHKGFQVLSLSYLRETAAMGQVVFQNDQTKITTLTTQNLNQATTLSLTSGGHTNISKVWVMDNQVGGTYGEVQTRIEGQAVRLVRFGWSASSDHTFALPRQLKLLVGGNYESAGVSGLFALKASGAFNLGLKKQLWADRATLSLKVSDLFYTNGWFSTVRYNNIDMDWTNRYESRRVALSFTGKLGSGKTQTRHAAGSSDEEGRAGH